MASLRVDSHPAARRKLLTAAAVTAAFVGLGWSYSQSISQERARKIALARSVTELPPGAEASWNAYVDRRLASTIQRYGKTLRVVALGDEVLQQTSFVSLGTPYRVGCAPVFGGTVDFGEGDTVVSVPIYGPLAEVNGAKAPALGVDVQSVAALRLWERLCVRISAYMQSVEK